MTALKSNSNTAWFNFQTYIYIYIYIADVAEWSMALDIRLSDWCCSVSMGVSSNPVDGTTTKFQLKDLILTLFGFIFRRIYPFKQGKCVTLDLF